MNRTYFFCKPLFFICFFLFAFSGYAQQATYAKSCIIVKFTSATTPVYTLKEGMVSFGVPAVDELNSKYHCTSAQRINVGRKSKVPGYTYVLFFSGNKDPKELVKAYTATGCFEYAEPDYIGKGSGEASTIPNDHYFSRQWGLHNDETFPYDSAKAGADIKMEQAWDIEKGDTSIIVAIIDCGAKLDHPELAGRIWQNYAENAGNIVDDDHNGFINDVNGWNFAYNNNDVRDDYGHGTNVAGIIGANGNNSIGYAGMDWYCKLMILKGLDSTNYGLYSWWADAVTYATDNGARIINMSLEGTGSSQTLQNAITYAYDNGVIVIACMGNYNSSAPSYPAACTHAMGIGATNDHDCRVNPFFWGGGSDFGSDISVVAPGNYIYGLDYLSNTNYNTYWGGTSQATPHVTGLAALLLAQDASRTPDQLRHIIEATADDLVGDPQEDTPGWDEYYGYGRINAYRALTYAQVGIPTTSADNYIKIYPNPSKGLVEIQMPDDLYGPCHVSVINDVGALVYSGTITGYQSEIDLSGYPQGTYMLKVNSNDFNFVQKEVLR